MFLLAFVGKYMLPLRALFSSSPTQYWLNILRTAIYKSILPRIMIQFSKLWSSISHEKQSDLVRNLVSLRQQTILRQADVLQRDQ
jgi:hypothetical protein